MTNWPNVYSSYQPPPTTLPPTAPPPPSGTHPPPAQPPSPTAPAPILSGAWWTTQYLDSTSINDLEPGFGSKVSLFIQALKESGKASCQVICTYRPMERAYLMHWSYLIAMTHLSAHTVPSMVGVNINWWHGDQGSSEQGAMQMVNGFGIAALGGAPDLNSRQSQRLAIDMAVAWVGALSIENADGAITDVKSTPRDGSNPDLISVGASYGVIHFANASAAPLHWSVDGT